MSTHELRYEVEGRAHVVSVEGGASWGPPEKLLSLDDDLVADAPWAERGFTVAPFLGPEPTEALSRGVTAMVRAFMRDAGVRTSEDFRLEEYHRYVTTEAAHSSVVERFRGAIPIERFPVDKRLVEARTGELCRRDLEVATIGGMQPFSLRIIRPSMNDHNPIHRDAWLPRLRGFVNLYVPIAGSTRLSSLGVIEGSHHWLESELCRTGENPVVNGRCFTVPALVGLHRPLTIIRPNPALGELMVFSPYMLHGGAANLETDRTRVSIELRLSRASVSAGV